MFQALYIIILTPSSNNYFKVQYFQRTYDKRGSKAGHSSL